MGPYPKKESMSTQANRMNETFLPPIETPKGLMMKLAYYFTRRQFGKVLTPLKVFPVHRGRARRPRLRDGVDQGQKDRP